MPVIAIPLGILLFLIYVLATWPTDPIEEQYKWVDTKYVGIRTRIEKLSSPSFRTTLEYPVTSNEAINTRVEEYIDTLHDEFANFLDLPGAGDAKKPSTMNSSYQIVSQWGDFISLLMQTRSTVRGQLSQEYSHGWTFNLKTGKEVRLKDAFGATATDGVARVKLYIKQKLRDKYGKGLYDESEIDDHLDSKELQSFSIPDARTIQFSFDQGNVADNMSGAIDVPLTVDNLQLFMQTETARSLFSVVNVERAPKYRATAKASVDCSIKRCIALTFDDGPSIYTGRLLDTLKSSDAHASFFMIGKNIERNPDLVKRAQNDGHTIGNRSWSIDTRDWADRNSDIIYNRVVAGAKQGQLSFCTIFIRRVLMPFLVF